MASTSAAFKDLAFLIADKAALSNASSEDTLRYAQAVKLLAETSNIAFWQEHYMEPASMMGSTNKSG